MKESKIILTIVILMIMQACNKEEPLPVSAKFTTTIQNNTLSVGERFTVYMSETTGEFLTYFKGDKEGTSYVGGFGTSLEVGTDSISLSGYSTEGIYTFTLVATSYGNWGEKMDQDVQSIDITVVSKE